MADGSIIIDTSLDSAGFEKGMARLEALADQGLANLTGEFNQAGKNLAYGLAAGVASGQGRATKAVADLGRSMVRELKAYLQIKSPSQLMRDEVGRNIALGVAAGISDNADEAVQAAVALAKATYEASKDFINSRKYYNEMALSEELLAWQRVQAQYVEGSAQRIAAEKEVYRVKSEIIGEIDRLEADYAAAVDRRTKQIVESFSLFEQVSPLKDVSGEALLANLNGQVEALKSWQTDLAALAETGISQDLLQVLTDLGPKAAAEIKALLSLSQVELDNYVALWQEKNALSREQAIAELVGLREDTNAQISLLLLGIEEQFAGAPEIGKQMTDGLAQGILSGLSNVVNAAVTVARAAIEAAKKELEINSPSKVFKEMGLQSDAGLAAGLLSGLAKVKQAAAGLQGVAPVFAGSPPAPLRTSETVVKEKVVGVRFEGTGADIARLLRPELVKEERILGRSFLEGEV